METLLRPTSDSSKLSILLIGSFFIHLLLFGLFYGLGYIELPSFLMSTKQINIKLAKASVRVDVVKMPDLTIKELKSLQQLESSGTGESLPIIQKQEVVADEDAFLKKKKKQDFMSMLKSLSRQKVETKVKKNKKVIKKKGPVGPKISGKIRGRLEKLLVAGNKLGTGTAIVGTGNADAQTELDLYASSLPEHVKPFWKLPSYLMNKNLTCRIKLYLAPDGELIKAEIFEPSGDSEYDGRALAAVKSSNPYPSLPDSITDFGGKGAIVLGFPL